MSFYFYYMVQERYNNFLWNEVISKYKNLEMLDFFYSNQVYRYGNQFVVDLDKEPNHFKQQFKEWMKEVLCMKRILTEKSDNSNCKGIILSNGYFGINNYLEQLGYNTVIGPWWYRNKGNIVNSINYTHTFYSFKRQLNNLTFQESLSEKCDLLLERLLVKTKELFRENQFKAVFASGNGAFENRLPLRAAKEEGIPTFVFLHGIPTYYDDDPQRIDYLLVWSEQLKQNCIKYANFPAERIFVTGHPYYQSFNLRELKNSLDNILIINPNSNDGAQQDRGILLLYMLMVEKVLRPLGVKSVRFRPHPGERAEWYLKYLDNNFFIPDTGPFVQAIEKSTLIIGTSSTVLIEAIFHGVNYILFDPLGNDQWQHIVPPFDGSDSFLPIAKTEEALASMIENHVCTNVELFHEYIKTPFDISFISDLIEKK